MEFELHLTMPRIQSLIQHTLYYGKHMHMNIKWQTTKQIFSRARFGAPGSDGLIAEVKSVKKKKNRIRGSKYFPLLDRRRGGDCDFRGGATRRRTQGNKNHRPKKMLREKKLQVVRILPGGKVEARVVSNRQLFLSITNSSTNCSFLVDTTSHHGEFVSDHLKNCNYSQF